MDQPKQEPETSRKEPAAKESDGPARRERPESPPTPFDHALFLPALLIAFTLYFGYDGFLTSDPEMLEHQTFNRVGFFVLIPVTVWFTVKGWREYKEESAAKRDADPGA